MGNASSYIRAICLISILIGLISSLIPSGGIKKAFNSMCSVVMIFSLVLPFADIKKSKWELKAYSYEENCKTLKSSERTAELMLYEKIVADAISSSLEEEGVKADIIVSARYEGDEMRVASVTVKGNLEKGEKEEAEAFISASFGEASIIFREESDG